MLMEKEGLEPVRHGKRPAKADDIDGLCGRMCELCRICKKRR